MATAAGIVSLLYGKIRVRLSYRVISMAGVTMWAIVFYIISKAQSQITIMLSVFFFGAGQGPDRGVRNDLPVDPRR